MAETEPPLHTIKTSPAMSDHSYYPFNTSQPEAHNNGQDSELEHVHGHGNVSNDTVTWSASQHNPEPQTPQPDGDMNTELDPGMKSKAIEKFRTDRNKKSKLKATYDTVHDQVRDIVTHPKSKYHDYRQHNRDRDRKGERKPLEVSDELDKLENSSTYGDNTGSGSSFYSSGEMPFESPSSTITESIPLRPLKSAIAKSLSKVHPKRIAKATASQKLSDQVLGLDLNPFRLTKEDVEFIKLCNKKRFEKDGKVISEHEQRLRELRIAKDKMLVNWISDRHMRSASVVRGKVIQFPVKEKTQEQTRRMYLQWMADFALYLSQRVIPPYTSPWQGLPRYEKKVTLSHIERIAIGTAPFQEWGMMVRLVYRWEDPAKSARWLVTYIILWKYQYLITFLYVYLISRVLRSRQEGYQVERVKATLSRARDHQQGVHQISELIERHGSDGWVEALPDTLGPWAQMKLGDLADILEVLRNFYEWRSPLQTVYTLIFFSVCILLSVFTDMQYCWRIITFVFGLWFFVSAPVASRWPQYRWAVSPFKWVFWGIPTHTEIAYSEFREDAIRSFNDPDKRSKSARRRARRRRMADYEDGPRMLIDDNDDDDGYVTNSPDIEGGEDDDPEELISPHIAHHPGSLGGKLPNTTIFCGFRCLHREHPGKLYISDYGLLFETELKKKLRVEIKWTDIKAIHKKENVSIGKVGKVHALVVELVDGEEVTLDAMLNRDKAFSRIIGFSDLKWQSGL